MRSGSKNGILLVAISAAAFGVMPIFAKIAYADGSSVYTLLFLRFFVGAVFMMALMFIRKMKMPTGREIAAFLLLGLIGYTGQSFCYFSALNYTTSATVSLLLYTYPALVTIGSVLFFKEKLTASKIISLLMALAGAFIIVGGEFKADLVGIALALAAAFFYTAYILVSSVVVKEGMGVQSSAFIMTGAAVSFGIMNIFMGFEAPSSATGCLSVVAIALLCTVLALWSFFTGMEKTGPSTASLVSTLEPIVTVAASAIVLSEPITAGTIVGGVMILAALLITMVKKENGQKQ